MTTFKIGDQVLLPPEFSGSVGTVIYYDDPSGRYLVRIGASQQLYFPPEQLTAWSADRRIKDADDEA